MVRRGDSTAALSGGLQSLISQQLGKVTNGHAGVGRLPETRYCAVAFQLRSACSRQHAHTPEGGVSECEEKNGARHASADCALAPALEHGDQSNQEEEHRHGGQTFDPHSVWPLTTKRHTWTILAERARVTSGGDAEERGRRRFVPAAASSYPDFCLRKWAIIPRPLQLTLLSVPPLTWSAASESDPNKKRPRSPTPRCGSVKCSS